MRPKICTATLVLNALFNVIGISILEEGNLIIRTKFVDSLGLNEYVSDHWMRF